nr:MAG TPA: hypothetical protein [Caudoviricetes sp.]
MKPFLKFRLFLYSIYKYRHYFYLYYYILYLMNLCHIYRHLTLMNRLVILLL